MVRRSVKKEFPSANSVNISEDESPYVPATSHQHSPSARDMPNEPDVEMTDMKDSQQTESVSFEGRPLSAYSLTQTSC